MGKPLVKTESKLITAKEAVNIAVSYFQEMTDSYTAGNISVAEIELSEDESNWFITLEVPSTRRDAMQAIYGGRVDYKVFKIDSKDSRVLSMKIRKVE